MASSSTCFRFIRNSWQTRSSLHDYEISYLIDCYIYLPVRTSVVKLLWLLYDLLSLSLSLLLLNIDTFSSQDASSPSVSEFLGLDVVRPILTVYSFLAQNKCLGVLNDQYCYRATMEIKSKYIYIYIPQPSA